MPHMTLLGLPGALTSSLSLPLEMFVGAHQVAVAQRHAAAPLTHQLVGKGEFVTTSSGLSLRLDADWETVTATDLIIVPSLWRDPRGHLRRQRDLLPWLRHHAANGALICAVGTGTFLVAEAGLLDDHPGTTHWFYLDRFAQRYPKVQLKRRHLITQAGNLYCAGSVNSVADLAIHFIDRYYGPQTARSVEAQFSPEIRRPFAEHAYAEGHSDVHGDELMIEAQSRLRAGGDPVSVADLADQLGISVRTLNRRFRQATGLTPQEYVLRQRLDVARELLRTSNLSITEVAAAVGYSDSAYFARLFRQQMKQSPRDFRTAVRGKLFSVDH